MEKLKLFEAFNEQKTEQERKFEELSTEGKKIAKLYKGIYNTLSSSWDFSDSITLRKEDCINGKIPIKIGIVDGAFSVNSCNLISLENSPSEVKGTFDASFNVITSLVDGPTKVNGDYLCNLNFLYSLEGSPSKINGIFDCRANRLKNFIGGPIIVGGIFKASGNVLITSNEGLPLYCSPRSGSKQLILGNEVLEIFLHQYYTQLNVAKTTFTKLSKLNTEEIKNVIIKKIIWICRGNQEKLVIFMQVFEKISSEMLEKLQTRIGKDYASGLLGANEWGMI